MMHKSTILNKLKLLDIRNPWLVTIVHELSNRRGASARMDTLFKDAIKRLKAVNNPSTKKACTNAIDTLLKYQLVEKKTTSCGPRLHLVRTVWHLEDAILQSVSATTISLSHGRRENIRWETLLREVRKELSNHKIILRPKVSKILVFYFLQRRCGWRIDQDKGLIPSKRKLQKRIKSSEQQQDLFHINF